MVSGALKKQYASNVLAADWLEGYASVAGNVGLFPEFPPEEESGRSVSGHEQSTPLKHIPQGAFEGTFESLGGTRAAYLKVLDYLLSVASTYPVSPAAAGSLTYRWRVFAGLWKHLAHFPEEELVQALSRWQTTRDEAAKDDFYEILAAWGQAHMQEPPEQCLKNLESWLQLVKQEEKPPVPAG